MYCDILGDRCVYCLAHIYLPKRSTVYGVFTWRTTYKIKVQYRLLIDVYWFSSTVGILFFRRYGMFVKVLCCLHILVYTFSRCLNYTCYIKARVDKREANDNSYGFMTNCTYMSTAYLLYQVEHLNKVTKFNWQFHWNHVMRYHVSSDDFNTTVLYQTIIVIHFNCLPLSKKIDR